MDSSPWVSTIDFNRALDFCVWILELDGMQVYPFDRHPDGDRSLRALGLDADDWSRLARAVAEALERRAVFQRGRGEVFEDVEARYEPHLQRSLQEIETRDLLGRTVVLLKGAVLVGRLIRTGRAETRRFGDVGYPHPPSFWSGAPVLRERLGELWIEYRKRYVASRRSYWKSYGVLKFMLSSRFQALNHAVEQRHPTPSPPITVCFVNYPGSVVWPLSGSTVLICTRNWRANAPAFEDVVWGAVDSLEARTS